VDQGGKAAIRWTRLSCHRFRANEVRCFFTLKVAESQLTQRLFAQIMRRIERLACHRT
jgi:hypothetical protein